MPPALQSTYIALTPSNSVGGGSGTPSAGNWLVCLSGWNQAGIAAATCADSDDIHSFWRPGDVTHSTWAVSQAAAKTRTNAWYTANLSRAPGGVYVAPSGAMAGRASLVLEIAGLGPWDVVTGIYPNYAAAATSLNLALAVPSAQALLIGAVTGDSTSAGQAFAPSGWTPLSTVTASNGVNHASDTVLTSAYLVTSGAISVNATASAPTDLSGVVIGVLTSAPQPLMGTNPNWPGRVIWEAAFGSGFQTPPDQRTWTVLSDTVQSKRRFWSLGDNTGVPYALGQLQSGSGTDQLDNSDGDLSPSNTASPYYPDVDTGTPVRMRCAVGTIKGNVQNRWSVIERNASELREKRNKARTNYLAMAVADTWSGMSGTCPSPYRGEVLQDLRGVTGWWWPCDDQNGVGGVKPTSLRNQAPGNTNPLLIVASPNGQFTTNQGTTSYATGNVNVNPTNAIYQVGQLPGWMYGDPQSSPASAQAGAMITAQPGAYAWQMTGGGCPNPGQAGYNSGGYGWFLSCNDTYPPLASGCTVESWSNFQNNYTNAGVASAGLQQPPTTLTIWEAATATGPTAVIFLDTSGHLQLTTYSGGSGTTTAIYTGSDLRIGAFLHVAAVFNSQTSITIYVNGGLTAVVTATVPSMTSAWSWFNANADMGSGGGGTYSGVQHIGNAAHSHLAIYPSALPAWRIWSHYNAAITGFGAVPAPSNVQVQTSTGKPYPDGSYYSLASYFSGPKALTALVVAVLGSYTSGPSGEAFASFASGSDGFYVSCNGLAPQFSFYTSQAAQSELLASSTTIEPAAGYPNAFGSGASPPTSPSAFGDTCGQRIERALGYGGATYPGRCIDPSPLLVQAALDIGGQATGANIQNIVNSDDGWLYVDTNGNLCYRQKSHLAADGIVWYIGMNVLAGQDPFDDTIEYSTDPQRVYNDIHATQYSPDGATLPLIGPSAAAAVIASQQQYNPRPLPYTSYLQDAGKILAQVNWRFTNYGVTRHRAKTLVIDAAKHPHAWPLFLNANPCDIIQVYDAPMGAPSLTANFRIATASRAMSFGANGMPVQAQLTLTCEYVPASYWS